MRTRWQHTWRTVRNGAFGTAAALSAHWLLQPALERAAARWGAWPVALTAGGAVVLASALFAAWLGLHRRRWLAGALGTLIAVALGKWAFVHAGYALVSRLGLWPGMAVAFGVPFAAFALAALVVAAVVLRRHAKPAYGRNTAHVDRAIHEHSVR